MVCFQLHFSTWLRVIKPKKKIPQPIPRTSSSSPLQGSLLSLWLHYLPPPPNTDFFFFSSPPPTPFTIHPTSLLVSYFNTLPLILSSPSSWKCCQKHLLPLVLPTSLQRKSSTWGYFSPHCPLAIVQRLNAWCLFRALAPHFAASLSHSSQHNYIHHCPNYVRV